MPSPTIDIETVRSALAVEGLALPEDRLGPMTEAVRAYRAMADLLHGDLPPAAEPAGLEIPSASESGPL
jgi:hypothetical protein